MTGRRQRKEDVSVVGFGAKARMIDGVVRARERIEAIGFKQIGPVLTSLSIMLVLFAVFHLYELTHFTISIDDEIGAFRDDPSLWLAQGRWTTYLFEQFVMQQPVLPFLPLALFGLFSSAGYLLFLRALGERRPAPLSFALFPLFASFPTWSFLTSFQSNTPSAGLGVLLSCWGAQIFRDGRERMAAGRLRGSPRMAAVGLLGAAAIGCYQSIALLLAAALFASIVSMALNGRSARLLSQDCWAAIAVLAVSLLLYMLILKLFLIFSGKDILYIQNFVRLQALRDSPWAVLSDTFQQMKDVYLGSRSVHGYASPVIAVLIALAFGGLVHGAYRAAGARGGLLAGLAALALLCIPFGMNLMSGGTVPLRTLVAVPAALTGLVFMGLKCGPRWLLRIGAIALLLVYFSMFKTLSGFNASRELVQTRDRQLALVLSERIASVAGPVKDGTSLMLDVFGAWPFQTPYPNGGGESTIGASIFAWDGGNPRRIVRYMELIGLPIFTVVDQERRAGLLDEFVAMPSWPAPGSVRAAADGTILVKLSDELNLNYRRVLVNRDPAAKADDRPFYRFSRSADGSWSVRNASIVSQSGEGIVLDAGSDPQLLFETGALRMTQACSRMELQARLRVERLTNVQVFYKRPGQADFSERAAIATQVEPAAGDGFVDVNLQLVSREGFVDSFRLDPVDGFQRVTIAAVELFCRKWRPGRQQ